MQARNLVGALASAAALLGWLGVVWGTALLLGVFAWPLGLGLLLLALAGWRFLWAVIRDGVYGLLYNDHPIPPAATPPKPPA